MTDRWLCQWCGDWNDDPDARSCEHCQLMRPEPGSSNVPRPRHPTATPDRGQWHRRDKRGGAPPTVQGAVGHYPCSFCEKVFRSDKSARQHERDFHAKRLRAMRSDQPSAPPAATIGDAIMDALPEKLTLRHRQERARRIIATMTLGEKPK